MPNEPTDDLKSSIVSHDYASKLHPGHLADLKKSGLSEETVEEAGIYSVRPADISKKMGFNDLRIESLLAFPYPGYDGVERYKLFPPLPDRKYHQRANTGSRLYIPEMARSLLSDPTVPLYVTEGEKKTLKGCQEGLTCIGLGGLWNWSDGTEEKNLISDFDLIALDGRIVNLVPDNDWLLPDRQGERKNLRQAVQELAYRLIDRGAKVYIVELPEGPLKGLDDYLCHHIIEELKALPKKEVRRQALDEMIEEASLDNLREILKRLRDSGGIEKEVYVERLSKKLKIAKRAIKDDLKRTDPQKASGQESLATAYFPKLVDLCIDDEGKTGFIIRDGDTIVVVSSYEVDSQIYVPPERIHLPFELPRSKGVLLWVGIGEDRKLFEDLENHLKRFSFLSDHQWTVVILFAFLTYVQDHPDIHYFPMLLFWAVPERGKSRTGKSLSYVCYRGIHLVDMREANLFRYSSNLHSTLFFDMMNLWKKAEQKGAEDILLLRYEKGAKVSRVLYPEKGPFKDTVYYDVYGPTIMATNEPVHHILDTRCLAISMPNKPGDYANPTTEQARELKERLTAWRARVMDEALPEVERIQGLNGRLWDISKSLFQVCKMVCPERFVTLKEATLEIAGKRAEEKQDTVEGQIISIIHDLSPDGVSDWTLQIPQIIETINRNRPEGHKLAAQYVGKKIKAIGLKTRKVHGHSEIMLTRTSFETLMTQYGLSDNSSSGALQKALPQATQATEPMDLGTCDGRLSVASDGESNDRRHPKDKRFQDDSPLVESGRELARDGNERFEINLREGEI